MPNLQLSQIRKNVCRCGIGWTALSGVAGRWAGVWVSGYGANEPAQTQPLYAHTQRQACTHSGHT